MGLRAIRVWGVSGHKGFYGFGACKGLLRLRVEFWLSWLQPKRETQSCRPARQDSLYETITQELHNLMIPNSTQPKVSITSSPTVESGSQTITMRMAFRVHSNYCQACTQTLKRHLSQLTPNYVQDRPQSQKHYPSLHPDPQLP